MKASKHNELIVKEGWVFLFPLAALAVVGTYLGWHLAILIVLWGLTLFTANFFRNPYRQIPQDPNAIVSPADGKVVAIHDLEDGNRMISVFLNVFNVHVNRAPISGTIEKIEYKKGKFLAAFNPDASQVNEQNIVGIRQDDIYIEVKQIAGLIARRIICWSQTNDQIKAGERFGLIRFGSRVDIVLSSKCQIEVRVGQNIKGGRDIIARKP